MICQQCRERRHMECPELDRQLDLTLPAVVRLSSPLCDCAHMPGSALRQDL